MKNMIFVIKSKPKKNKWFEPSKTTLHRLVEERYARLCYKKWNVQKFH